MTARPATVPAPIPTIRVLPTKGSEWLVTCAGLNRGVYRDKAMATAAAESLDKALAADARIMDSEYE